MRDIPGARSRSIYLGSTRFSAVHIACEYRGRCDVVSKCQFNHRPASQLTDLSNCQRASTATRARDSNVRRIVHRTDAGLTSPDGGQFSAASQERSAHLPSGSSKEIRVTRGKGARREIRPGKQSRFISAILTPGISAPLSIARCRRARVRLLRRSVPFLRPRRKQARQEISDSDNACILNNKIYYSYIQTFTYSFDHLINHEAR